MNRTDGAHPPGMPRALVAGRASDVEQSAEHRLADGHLDRPARGASGNSAAQA